MQKTAGNQILFLGGLKGFLALLIILIHYLMAFFPYGHIGWGTGCAANDCCRVYFQNYPTSLIMQFACLPLFYAMIAYIPAIKVFRDSNTAFIEKQALSRYFRLMPPVLATVLFSYAVYAFGFSQHLKISELIGNQWIKASSYYSAVSWLGAFKNGLWDTFVQEGAGGYCSVLWCIHQIFIGSYLTYGFMLMFRNVKYRLPIYLACYLLLLGHPQYCGFLSGIAAADVCLHVRTEKLKRFAVPFLVLSLLLFVFPKPLSSAWFPTVYCEGIASFFLLCAVPFLPVLDRILSGKTIGWFGKRSFSIILTHFPIMISVSALVFERLYAAQVPQFACMLVALLAGLPLILAVSEIMYRLVEIPTGRFTKYLVGKLT